MTVSYKFDFGIGAVPAAPYIQVLPDTLYSEVTGYGFENNERVSSRDRGEDDRLRGAFCIPLEAVFTVDLPNGCYTVTATIGDAIAPTSTTLKYGTGRIVLHKAAASAGQYAVHSFTVKVTDGQLRLAFSGIAPRINALQIARAKQATTIYLAGDSTVTDQDTFPYAGWGQMLPLYFKTDVAIDNHAMSGRSSRSFIDEGRLAAILEQIMPNDYLWIQFGHNDQKPDVERATEPFGSYKEMLAVYVEEARARDARPVLITPMHRRKFDREGRIIDTHGDYLLGMKQLAAELDVPLIDLAAKSQALYEQLGDEPSKALFMWAYPGEFIHFPDGAQDDTHFQELGGIQIAGLVAEGVRELGLSPLNLYLKGI
ncbi:GDSL-type esterase/lipase family protein [Paenibacillus alkaliterrae]|uniref:rhamnogalacturonan acetylesterase n=1 Tax=Paenibacillus alkaliterrae TaxID=320909 RepID=UPI001F1E5170|nr:GDSL-type esterase/lipase family protein [Paenibacillus alkaliterrae]MCF2938735.1 GDSL-type esterase/lipase family protein [Paenibacillus alkaliterrae]